MGSALFLIGIAFLASMGEFSPKSFVPIDYNGSTVVDSSEVAAVVVKAKLIGIDLTRVTFTDLEEDFKKMKSDLGLDSAMDIYCIWESDGESFTPLDFNIQ